MDRPTDGQTKLHLKESQVSDDDLTTLKLSLSSTSSSSSSSSSSSTCYSSSSSYHSCLCFVINDVLNSENRIHSFFPTSNAGRIRRGIRGRDKSLFNLSVPFCFTLTVCFSVSLFFFRLLHFFPRLFLSLYVPSSFRVSRRGSLTALLRTFASACVLL